MRRIFFKLKVPLRGFRGKAKPLLIVYFSPALAAIFLCFDKLSITKMISAKSGLANKSLGYYDLAKAKKFKIFNPSVKTDGKELKKQQLILLSLANRFKIASYLAMTMLSLPLASANGSKHKFNRLWPDLENLQLFT